MRQPTDIRLGKFSEPSSAHRAATAVAVALGRMSRDPDAVSDYLQLILPILLYIALGTPEAIVIGHSMAHVAKRALIHLGNGPR